MIAAASNAEDNEVPLALRLSVYGGAHAVIDAGCAGILLTLWSSSQGDGADVGWVFAYYLLLAFGLQAVFGALVDSVHAPRLAAVSGCAMLAAGVASFSVSPGLGVTLAGVGNSLFHIGAGTMSLALRPGRSGPPGVFVAPGTIGLAVGGYLGKAGLFPVWVFVAGAIVFAVAVAALPTPADCYRARAREQRDYTGFVVPVAMLLLLCIAIRALVGVNLSFEWKSQLPWLVALTIAVTAGKGFGGYIADRFGWWPVAGGALLLSAPILVFAPQVAALAVFGALLFNFTMPVTLAATAGLFPRRPGFAFGMTCFALYIGVSASNYAAPVLAGSRKNAVLLAILAIATVALYLGLRLAGRRNVGAPGSGEHRHEGVPAGGLGAPVGV